VRFQVSMAVILNFQTFWHVSLFRWCKIFRSFERWWSLKLQSQAVQKLKMKALRPIETSDITYLKTQRPITTCLKLICYKSPSQSRCWKPSNTDSCFWVSDILLYIFVRDIQMADRLSERPVSTNDKTTQNKRKHIAIIITKLGNNPFFRALE